MNRTVEQLAAIAQIRNTFVSNISSIRHALNSAKPADFVWCWPNHWLGAIINGDKVQACGVERATIVSRVAKDRKITNGNGARAVLMRRDDALRGALVHAVDVLENFERNLVL